MPTLGNLTSSETREALKRMRRLALAFHGSELRLTDRPARGARSPQPAKARRVRAKAVAQA